MIRQYNSQDTWESIPPSPVDSLDPQYATELLNEVDQIIDTIDTSSSEERDLDDNPNDR